MTMTITQQLITIIMIVLGTMLTRFFPFIVFPPNKTTPRYIQYLGEVLSLAALALLVVYCFKDVGFLTGSHGFPEIISVAVVILLHVWKGKMLLSIAGGTLFYMLLVQNIF